VPTQAERTDTTRRALLNAGLAAFQEHGYADLGVDELCAHAGVTSGALYHQFGSKAGLFRAVYDELVAGTSARIAAARSANPTPSLSADCEVYLDACSDPAFFRITADAPSVIGWEAILDDTQELIAASLTLAQAAGEIDRDLPIPATARMLAAALKEAGVMIATAPDAANARAEASETARRLLSGLTRSAGPRGADSSRVASRR
jgi:AcrR family transcriptional regulator